MQSCSETVLSEGEVFLSLLHFHDLLCFLVEAQSGSEGSGEFGSQELGSSGGASVEVAGKGLSFLLV